MGTGDNPPNLPHWISDEQANCTLFESCARVRLGSNGKFSFCARRLFNCAPGVCACLISVIIDGLKLGAPGAPAESFPTLSFHRSQACREHARVNCHDSQMIRLQ